MKYRIKTVTYATGRKEYLAQVMNYFWWRNIDFRGQADSVPMPCSNKEEALSRIDMHIRGNTKVKQTSLEYVKKA